MTPQPCILRSPSAPEAALTLITMGNLTHASRHRPAGLKRCTLHFKLSDRGRDDDDGAVGQKESLPALVPVVAAVHTVLEQPSRS